MVHIHGHRRWWIRDRKVEGALWSKRSHSVGDHGDAFAGGNQSQNRGVLRGFDLGVVGTSDRCKEFLQLGVKRGRQSPVEANERPCVDVGNRDLFRIDKIRVRSDDQEEWLLEEFRGQQVIVELGGTTDAEVDVAGPQRVDLISTRHDLEIVLHLRPALSKRS